MRHNFSLLRPPADHLGGVHLPGMAGLAIPATRLAQCPATCLPGASARAVDLPAVAAAADDNLRTTADAQKQAARHQRSVARVADTT
jgi:hypothetical protein